MKEKVRDLPCQVANEERKTTTNYMNNKVIVQYTPYNNTIFNS